MERSKIVGLRWTHFAAMLLGVVGIAVAGSAFAQTAAPSASEPAAAEPAATETWYGDYIEPNRDKLPDGERGEGLTVPLEPHPELPSEAAAAKLPAGRQLTAPGPIGTLVMDFEVPMERGSWNDESHAKAFRFYLAPPAPTPTIASGAVPGT